MKKIAVFTSGGDAPGMNACIRAAVRTALFHKIEVYGIMHGYEGMIDGEIVQLKAKSVANIIQRGGTMLKTARSQRFMTRDGMMQAAEQLKKLGIEGVVAIGGDGTYRGALEFSKVCDIPFVGCPGTIDNDLAGTDYTIGYDTAINTAVEAIDKIRDTAESHDRLFFVEVMGRHSGNIALLSGIASGAESILIPETKTDVDKLIKRLQQGRKDKRSRIIIVAEGDEAGGAFTIAEQVKKTLPFFDTRVTILGHIQRGGNPTASDRVYASRLGYAAVEALRDGHRNVALGFIKSELSYTPFTEAVKQVQDPEHALLRMVEILSM
jgi:6-phosphofructokinase 1